MRGFILLGLSCKLHELLLTTLLCVCFIGGECQGLEVCHIWVVISAVIHFHCACSYTYLNLLSGVARDQQLYVSGALHLLPNICVISASTYPTGLKILPIHAPQSTLWLAAQQRGKVMQQRAQRLQRAPGTSHRVATGCWRHQGLVRHWCFSCCSASG